MCAIYIGHLHVRVGILILFGKAIDPIKSRFWCTEL